MSRRLTGFSALTFDCYGTLIDWESGIWGAMRPLLLENDRVKVTRAAALEAFAESEPVEESEHPGARYPDILARVHRRVATRFGLRSTPELDEAFGASVPHWPAFPDSADALRVLKTHFKLVILSNVHGEGIRASIDALGVPFDAVYTAEDIGSYKPDLSNFAYMLEHLAEDHGIPPEQVLHTAQSLFHDHAPAKRMGLATAWIDRQGLANGGAWGATARVLDLPEVDFRFPTLGAMSEAVRLEGSASATDD